MIRVATTMAAMSLAISAWAQSPETMKRGDAPAPAEAPAEAPASSKAEVPLLEALKLPGAAEKAREAGVPVDDVKEALEALRGKDASAGEAKDVIVAAEEAARENGPVDNFGAFVQSQLEAGLRGRDLAAAIHAEHAARGKGKPDHAGGGKPDGAGGGKPDHAGGGKPDHAGGGKPDGAGGGKPDGAGGGKPDHAGGGKPEGAGKGRKP